MIDVDRHCCDGYRASDDVLWGLLPMDAGQGVTLASVGLTLSPSQLWAEID